VARYGSGSDENNYPDDEPTRQFSSYDYGDGGQGDQTPQAWYRKPVALVAFGAVGAVLIALIVFGLAKAITGDDSPSEPTTSLTPLTTTSTVAPTSTETTAASSEETTTTTTEPTTTTTTTPSTTTTTSPTTTTTTTTPPTTSVSTSTSTVTQTETETVTQTPPPTP
jgi:cytoskeletal protein RodZ